MASLYRPTYTRTDPKTGGRVTRRLRKWYGKHRDASGRLRCVPLSNNKTAATAMLTDLVRKVELQKAGLVDPCADHLARPIDDHIGDFRVHLEAKARSTGHVRETVRILKNVASACGLKTLLELQTAGVRFERHLYDRRRSGASHRTVNADLVAVRSFCRWLLHRMRMHDDPTHGLERLNEDEDPRIERRAAPSYRDAASDSRNGPNAAPINLGPTHEEILLVIFDRTASGNKPACLAHALVVSFNRDIPPNNRQDCHSLCVVGLPLELDRALDIDVVVKTDHAIHVTYIDLKGFTDRCP
jgi:hypothetical protein